jgi:hypothetical protein
MTAAEIDSYNASYFRIDVGRMVEHNKLMTMRMCDWPEDLKQFLQNGPTIYSGDGIACRVADWLKTQPIRSY